MSRRDNDKPIVPHVKVGTLGHKDKPKEALEVAINNYLNKVKSNKGEKEER